MNRKYLPQRESELSVNQDLYPNFCNLNISFGSWPRLSFFFKSRTKVKVKFLVRTAMSATKNRIYTNRTKKLRFKKKYVGVWAFVIGLSQISSFLSCCRYTRKFKNQKLCCHVCNITYSLKDNYRKWWGSRHVYYAFDVWKDGGINFSFTHFLVSMFIAAI